MAIVTVTGNAWDHSRRIIPAEKRPELWFKPTQANVRAGALLVGVESKATLSLQTGAFSVDLDNAGKCRYRPVMRWVNNPAEPNPELWSWGYSEWPFDFWPGVVGGDIGTLIDRDPGALAYYYGPLSDPPPPGFRGWWEVQAEPGREDSDDPFIGDVRRVYGG